MCPVPVTGVDGQDARDVQQLEQPLAAADLPGDLASPAAAVRIGKLPKQDKVLKGTGKSITAVAKVQPGVAAIGVTVRFSAP